MARYIISPTESDSINGFYDNDPADDIKVNHFCSAGDALKLFLEAAEESRLDIETLASEMDNYSNNIVGVDITTDDGKPIISYTLTIKATPITYEK